MENFLKDSWFTTIFTGKTTEGDKISATTMNVTKIVTFFVTLFAGLTQIIKLTAAKFPITAGQMVVIWMGVATLVVLLAIADMATRAYVTAHTPPPAERKEETSLDALRSLGKGKFAEEPTKGAAEREAELIGLVTGSKPFVYLGFDSAGKKVETYVEPQLVHK